MPPPEMPDKESSDKIRSLEKRLATTVKRTSTLTVKLVVFKKSQRKEFKSTTAKASRKKGVTEVKGLIPEIPNG